MKKLFIVLLIITAILNCNSKNESVTIKDRTVLFFSISQDEYDKITSSDKSGDIDEILSNFSYFANNTAENFKKYNINVLMSASYRFKFIYADKKVEIFDRRKKEDWVGFIMFDKNKKPKIKYGVSTDIEILNSAQKYFNINLLNNN